MDNVEIVTGTELKTGKHYSVSNIVTTPGEYTSTKSGSLMGADIALVTTTFATDSPPLRVRLTSPLSVIGHTPRAYGYGVTPGGSSGVQRAVDVAVASVGERDI